MPADFSMPAQRTDMGGYTLIEHASLKTLNTLRVDVRTRLLAEVQDASRLPELLAFPAVRDGELLALGEGSNVLFVDDFPGTVIVLANRGVKAEDDGDLTRIAVAAGERWDDFVRWTLGQGYAGLENLILIPGSVGAAPIQNIGAYGSEVGEYVESVEAWDRHTQSVTLLDKAACAFGYRDSVFKRTPDRYLITAVRFALPRSRELRLDYAGIRDELARMEVDKPTPFHVAEAVVRLRTRKLPDPAVIGNAGSFFKNPIVQRAQADTLLSEHPDLVAWPNTAGSSKLSAAWLIEAAGLKGYRQGDAGISNRHALILVNHGHASGHELWTVAQHVIATVQSKFGVHLEPEPRIIAMDGTTTRR